MRFLSGRYSGKERRRSGRRSERGRGKRSKRRRGRGTRRGNDSKKGNNAGGIKGKAETMHGPARSLPSVVDKRNRNQERTRSPRPDKGKGKENKERDTTTDTASTSMPTPTQSQSHRTSQKPPDPESKSYIPYTCDEAEAAGMKILCAKFKSAAAWEREQKDREARRTILRARMEGRVLAGTGSDGREGTMASTTSFGSTTSMLTLASGGGALGLGLDGGGGRRRGRRDIGAQVRVWRLRWRRLFLLQVSLLLLLLKLIRRGYRGRNRALGFRDGRASSTSISTWTTTIRSSLRRGSAFVCSPHSSQTRT